MTRSKPRTSHVVIDEERGWRFDKRLSINTLVSIVGAFAVFGGPLFYWGNAMDKRVQTLELAKQEAEKQNTKDLADGRDARAELNTRLGKMDDKLSGLQVQVGQLIVQLNLTKGAAR